MSPLFINGPQQPHQPDERPANCDPKVRETLKLTACRLTRVRSLYEKFEIKYFDCHLSHVIFPISKSGADPHCLSIAKIFLSLCFFYLLQLAPPPGRDGLPGFFM